MKSTSRPPYRIKPIQNPITALYKQYMDKVLELQRGLGNEQLARHLCKVDLSTFIWLWAALNDKCRDQIESCVDQDGGDDQIFHLRMQNHKVIEEILVLLNLQNQEEMSVKLDDMPQGESRLGFGLADRKGGTRTVPRKLDLHTVPNSNERVPARPSICTNSVKFPIMRLSTPPTTGTDAEESSNDDEYVRNTPLQNGKKAKNLKNHPKVVQDPAAYSSAAGSSSEESEGDDI